MEVHEPADTAHHLETLMNTSVMSMGFGGAKKLQQDLAKTVYFEFSNKSERDEWVTAVDNNFKAYLSSDQCVEDTKKMFCSFLHNIGSNGESFEWRKILFELYSS